MELHGYRRSVVEQLEQRTLLTSLMSTDAAAGLVGPARPPAPFQFQDSARWTTTATNGSGLLQGDRTTLRWSIVPDGTTVPSGKAGNGEPAAGSNLRARLNFIYGSMATWLPIISAAVSSWAAQTGLTYVYEPNDDGIAYSASNRGITGRRGDIRIGGHAIDGDESTRAYSFAPNYGDIVIDTDDDFFLNTAQNSLGLRNVLAHELGHGLGLNHVYPINQTKLMEPAISLAFDGPQLDDVLAANRGYGDRFEKVGLGQNNDLEGWATQLGTLGVGTRTERLLSIDDETDTDFFRFVLDGPRSVTITITPVGGTYETGSEQNVTTFNAEAQSDLSFQLQNDGAHVIYGSSNTGGLGATETIHNLNLEEGCYIRISGSTLDRAQMYDLSIEVKDVWLFADIAPVAPDPRVTPVDAITITFPEAVEGFDVSDFVLIRDDENESLANATLTTTDNVTFTLGNLTAITDRVGGFQLTLNAPTSGIRTVAEGEFLGTPAIEFWRMIGLNGTPGDDVIRVRRSGDWVEVFYNNLGTTPTYSYVFGIVPTLTINTGAGNDDFILDRTQGSPLQSGVTNAYDGGTSGEAGDRVSVVLATNGSANLSANHIGDTGPLEYTNVETVDLTNGRYTLDGDMPALILNGNAAVQVINQSIRLPSLTMGSETTFHMIPTANGLPSTLLRTGAISMGDGAVLDLHQSDMIVDDGVTQQLGAIQALVISGRAGGAWNGPGITSSSARNVPRTTLGAMTGQQYSSVNGGAVTFLGEAFSPAATLVKYTYYGDANFSGSVNFDDYARIDSGFNNGRTGWVNGDFNANGVVNFDDYALIDSAFNLHGAQL